MAWLRCENTIRKTVQSVALRKMLTTIGRAAGNDVVLDDPLVAGTHANVVRQGSTWTVHLVDKGAELYVNGQRTSQSALYPGDVISLAGLPIIFGQDNPPPSTASGNTAPLAPSTSERTTAVLKNGSSKPEK